MAEMVAAGWRFAGSRVVGCEDRGGTKVLLDEAGEVDFVLACDGARSAMRQRIGVRGNVFEYPHGALWAMGRSERVRGRLWQVTHGTKRMCGLLPMGGGRCSMFWSLQTRELDSFYARGFEAWRAEAVGLCPEAEELLCGLSGFEETRFTTYYHVRMRRWFNADCLLLGDAAHAMSPHLGQGINLAMVDAYCFSRVLEEVGDFAVACRRYEAMRRRHLQVYGAVTFLLSPFFQSRGWVKGILRDIGLPLMPRVGFVRRQTQLTMAGLRAGWLGGSLRLPAPRPSEAQQNLRSVRWPDACLQWRMRGHLFEGTGMRRASGAISLVLIGSGLLLHALHDNSSSTGWSSYGTSTDFGSPSAGVALDDANGATQPSTQGCFL